MDLTVWRPATREATVGWTAVPEATSYRIQLQSSETPGLYQSSGTFYDTSQCSWEVPTGVLEAGKYYRVTVEAWPAGVDPDPVTCADTPEVTSMEVAISFETPAPEEQKHLSQDSEEFRAGTQPDTPESTSMEVAISSETPAPEEQKHLSQDSKEFRAELTKAELEKLNRRATEFINPRRMRTLKWFYRTKLTTYFDDIADNHGNVMEKYIKDKNGDLGSPINDALEGLFFSVCVGKNDGEPFQTSNFGPRRLLIPAEVLFERLPKLYFTDFYCNYDSHYVTLVMTKEGSEADLFCQEKLLPLDVATNPFVQYKNTPSGPEMKVICDDLWVELLYTEDLDITELIEEHEAKFENVSWKGNTTHGGRPKNRRCQKCNL